MPVLSELDQLPGHPFVSRKFVRCGNELHIDEPSRDHKEIAKEAGCLDSQTNGSPLVTDGGFIYSPSQEAAVVVLHDFTGTTIPEALIDLDENSEIYKDTLRRLRIETAKIIADLLQVLVVVEDVFGEEKNSNIKPSLN